VQALPKEHTALAYGAHLPHLHCTKRSAVQVWRAVPGSVGVIGGVSRKSYQDFDIKDKSCGKNLSQLFHFK
jgi:hypothetical protein